MGSTNSIGEVLRIARKANNFTMEMAANISGVSKIYISELEKKRKSNISQEVLEKLANAYDLHLDQIFELEAFYKSLNDLPVNRKFRKTFLKALQMMEMNYEELTQ